MANALTTLLVLTFAAAVGATPPTRLECAVLLSLKSSVYRQIGMARSVEIASGSVDPLEYYNWNDALFLNWQIVAETVHDLEDVLDFPNDIHIANISLVEGEKPGPYLSLVAKHVDVIRLDPNLPSTTTQLDWMTYVKKGNDNAEEPNLMIIDSIYDFGVVTPLGQVLANGIDYLVQDDVAVASVDKDCCTTRLDLMLELGIAENETVSESFLASFDRLYWPSGIYSMLASDSSLRNAHKVRIIRRSLREQWGAQDISHPWSDYTELIPRHSFFFPETIGLAAEVWVNIDDRLSHTLDDDECEYLLQSKKELYSQRAAIEASRVAEFSSETLVKFAITDSVPAYFLNFRLRPDMLDALATEVGLPDGFTLAPIRMRMNGPEEYILTLNVYAVEGIVSGLRAEWSVFVKEDGSDQPLFMIVEALSSGMSLDQINLLQMTGAEQLENYVEGGLLTTVIVENSGDPDGTTFTATFPLPNICTEINASCDMPHPALIAASDRMYWSNGVYDKGHWDGNTWRIEPLAIFDASDVAVADGTKWSGYLEGVSEVVVYFEDQTFLIGPWYNLNDVCPPP